jgi:hypothetical protein
MNPVEEDGKGDQAVLARIGDKKKKDKASDAADAEMDWTPYPSPRPFRIPPNLRSGLLRRARAHRVGVRPFGPGELRCMCGGACAVGVRP